MVGGYYKDSTKGGGYHAQLNNECTGTASFTDEYTGNYPITQNPVYFDDCSYIGDWYYCLEDFLLCWKKHHSLIYKMLGHIFQHIANRILSGQLTGNEKPKQKASEYG